MGSVPYHLNCNAAPIPGCAPVFRQTSRCYPAGAQNRRSGQNPEGSLSAPRRRALLLSHRVAEFEGRVNALLDYAETHPQATLGEPEAGARQLSRDCLLRRGFGGVAARSATADPGDLCPVIASEAWQSRRRSKHRSPKGIARFVKDRASLLAMTKWVRVRANRSSPLGCGPALAAKGSPRNPAFVI